LLSLICLRTTIFKLTFCSDHNTGFFVRLVDLADSVDEAGVSEGQVLLDREVPVFFDSGAHDFLEAGVDNVELCGTLDLFTILLLVAHNLEQTHL
jgi:hypothetical protein